MSYVLDALNKSQQQAQPRSAPTLSSEHITTKPKTNNRRLISLCLAVVMMINIGLVWYFFNHDPAVATMTAAQLSPPPQSLQAQPTTGSPPAKEPEPIAQDQYRQPHRTIAPQAPARPTNLPTLNITSHVYADGPQYRQVFINGRSLQQLDWLQDDLQVKEITELGVIFLYRGVEFAVDLETHWQ